MGTPQNYHPQDSRNLFERILKGEAGRDAIKLELDRITPYSLQDLQNYQNDLKGFDFGKSLGTFDHNGMISENLHYIILKPDNDPESKILYYFGYNGYSNYIGFCKSIIQLLAEGGKAKKKGSKSEYSFQLISKGKAKHLKYVYDSLINDLFIDNQTTLINFKAIFSGDLVENGKKIKWIRSISSLVYFIQKLHDPKLRICKTNAFRQTALNCFFIKKNNTFEELKNSQLGKPGKLLDDDKTRIEIAIKPLLKVDSK